MRINLSDEFCFKEINQYAQVVEKKGKVILIRNIILVEGCKILAEGIQSLKHLQTISLNLA